MTGWPDQPVIYEIGTAVWLDELSRAAGRPVTLASVGAADWDAAVPAGVDVVWLMRVWGRSPAGLALANANAGLQASFADALRMPLDWPDLPGRSWQLTDIPGQSVFERDGAELASPGLFVDLEPWQFHLLALQ
ncbi:MAG TPA: hypothetical protein VJ347_23015 [Streptosporangiaceae bacterium]|jgi:hypothetical protein|nr:hypothetical protein [Streptosporangiaceae bacterium]